ncbi:MAG: choice-of-anchor D domain-containing protein, partial [Candidatus Cloacimonetes bacterium]|nr:choice-of-anchor D domain-containing protein [Candidatus Cloacimonadota bacterium]
MPADWSTINTVTGGTIVTNTYNDQSYPYCIRMGITTTLTGDLLFISPAVSGTAITETRVKFWAKTGSNNADPERLIVGTMSDPDDPATFTARKTIFLTTSYTEYTVGFSSAPSGDTYVAFKHGLDGTYDYHYIDDFTWELLPLDPVFGVDPESKDYGTVYLGGVSSQTFTISNTAGGTLTINSVALTGTDADQFTLTDLNSYPEDLGGSESITVSVAFSPNSEGAKSANLQIIDNLTRTTHDVALTGTGHDAYVSLPYSEDFDEVTVPALPTDWSKFKDVSSSYAVIKTRASNAYSEPNCAYISNYNHTTGNMLLISPPTATSIDSTRVKFMAKGAVGQNLIVGTMTDPTDASTFTAVETVPLTAAYAEYTVKLNGAPSGDTHVVFKHGMDTSYDINYIDDFIWELIPTTPVFGVDPESYDFGTLNLGASSTKSFTVTNVGIGTLNVSGA